MGLKDDKDSSLECGLIGFVPKGKYLPFEISIHIISSKRLANIEDFPFWLPLFPLIRDAKKSSPSMTSILKFLYRSLRSP